MLASAKTPDDRLTAIASDLLQRKIDAVTHAGGGGNSRIYRICAGEESYALKIYPVIENDPRDRLSVEKKALQFFERHGLDLVPRWIADCPGHAVLTWVEGELANPPTTHEIDLAVRFLDDIKRLSMMPGAESMPQASEACISGAEVVRQIEGRLQNLQKISAPELECFLRQSFIKSFEEARTAAQAHYASANIMFDAPLDFGRSLVPADFGFHNVLRNRNGIITFIDFEYFGWDDPVKLTADFLIHPGQKLSAVQRRHFHSRMQNVFSDDPNFSLRLNALMPLFNLRWVLILLNEYIPERWRGRAFARGESEWEMVKKRQLGKASELLKNRLWEEIYA